MTAHDKLLPLIGEWVTVTNPDVPASWYGKLVGLADQPSVLIQAPGGGQTCLPQSFTVERCDLEQQPAPAPAGLRERYAALFRHPPGMQRLGDATPGEIADAILAVRDTELEQLRAEAQQMAVDLDNRDETIRHLDAGLQHERATIERVRAECDRLDSARDGLDADCESFGDGYADAAARIRAALNPQEQPDA